MSWRRASLSTVLARLAGRRALPGTSGGGTSAGGASVGGSTVGHSVATLVGPLPLGEGPSGPVTTEEAAASTGKAGAAGGDSRRRRRRRGATSEPVVLGGALVRQTDETTCGSTVLLMLAATGDPALASWLEDGTPPDGLPAHRIPPEIPPHLVQTPPADAEERLTAAQQWLKRRTSARALGLLPWPASLGTPPWTAAREARFPGVRYRGVPVDDAAPSAATVLAQVHRATLAGVPVPLYTGGDLGRGLTTAIPRHVVLAVPPPAGASHRGRDDAGRPVLHVYEPASGRVHAVPVGDLLGRREPHPALGGWTHVTWALLPQRSVAPGARPEQSGAGPGDRSPDRPPSRRTEEKS